MAADDSVWKRLLMGTPEEVTPQQRAGRLEALGQGLTLGWGDELGAGLQAGMAALTPGMSAKDTYYQARAENRDILRRQREAEPVRSAALEVLGSLPLAALPVGAMGQGATLGARLLNTAKAVAPMGAMQGLGASERDDVLGKVDAMAGGANTAMLTGMATEAAPVAYSAVTRSEPFQKLATALALKKAQLGGASTLDLQDLLDSRKVQAVIGDNPAMMRTARERSQSLVDGRPDPDVVNRIQDYEDEFLEGAARRGGIRNNHIVDPNTGEIVIPAKPHFSNLKPEDYVEVSLGDLSGPNLPPSAPPENVTKAEPLLSDTLRPRRPKKP